MFHKKILRVTVLCLVTILTQGCGMNKINQYQNNTPILMIDDFFAHPVKGYGMVQKNSGEVRRRFTVSMQGHWTGDKGVLDEHFLYDDGEKQSRQWHLIRQDKRHFTATAADVTGTATGEQVGNAIHMNYVLQVPYMGKTIDVSMDDWLYRVDEHVVLNSAVMKKFGIPIGRVTASFFRE